MEAIEVKNLQKSFRSQRALDGLSFTIHQGEFYGLLGPNGAGKTTTLSIITSLLQPDRGRVLIKGEDPNGSALDFKKIIGVVPQEIALYEELSALDNLKFWGSLYQIPISELIPRIEEILRVFGLAERKGDLIRTYSGGMKRRINIAAAILHRPEILFMDEPTVGIDPQSRNLIFEVIEKLHQDGMTIIYTTHYMEEAERLCDRIGIIDNGKIIAEGTLEELRSRDRHKAIIIIEFESLKTKVYESLQSFWQKIERKKNTLKFFSSQPTTDLLKIIQKCSDLKAPIRNIEVKQINLETIFLSLTGKQLRD